MPAQGTRPWKLTLRRTYRPWWGFGLVAQTHEMDLSRSATEEEILAGLADLKAAYPKWEFDLRAA